MALQVAGLSLSKLAEAPCQAICQCMPVFFFPPCRRKFRSQTFDNMDRWKRRGGKSQRRERQKKQAQRRERARRKKMQAREKVEKSRNTVFFQCFVPPEGRKVSSLKRRVRSQLARWEIKNCTPLWREADLEINMLKTFQPRSTFGSWAVEKVPAAVVLSTFPSQKAQSTPGPETFGSWSWDAEKVHAVAARSTFRSQNAKTTQCRTAFRSCIFEKMHPWRSRSTFGCWDVEKVHAVVARSTKSKVLKTDGLGPLLDVQMSKNWTLTVR